MVMHMGDLHHIQVHVVPIPTSLYTDDAPLFVAPIKEDIYQLVLILGGFGEAIGLATNI